jgi:hypothetical protein
LFIAAVISVNHRVLSPRRQSLARVAQTGKKKKKKSFYFCAPRALPLRVLVFVVLMCLVNRRN